MIWGSVVFGAFLGVAGLFTLTALALYPVMRRSFLLWLALRIICFAAMAVFLFPVALPEIFPEGKTRWIIGEFWVALAVAFSGPMLASYLEDDLDLRDVRRELYALGPLAFVAAVCSLLSSRGRVFDHIHDAVLLFVIMAVIAALYRAIAAGSRAARFQAGAWAPLILIGLAELICELAFGIALPGWPAAVLMALVLDFIITALGVIDGFMVIKRERDRAFADVAAAHIAVATDPLTGIANRRGLALRFRDPAIGRPLGLAVLDCDHFKRVNDLYGHDVGDEVLVAVAQSLQGENVFAARHGGEEFVILFYDTAWERDLELLRRRLPIAVLEAVPEVGFPITASAGMAAIQPTDTLDTAIKRADRALYAAKDGGRDLALVQKPAGVIGPRQAGTS